MPITPDTKRKNPTSMSTAAKGFLAREDIIVCGTWPATSLAPIAKRMKPGNRKEDRMAGYLYLWLRNLKPTE